MIKILSELDPDVAFASLLDGKVEVQTSATARHTIKCYADGKMPNKGLDDEFLSVLWNGPVSAKATGLGCMEGNLILSIYCRLHNDNTVKTQRVRQILGQIQKLANRKSAKGFFFSIDPSQLITPTTANQTSGYSTTRINVEWHESDI